MQSSKLLLLYGEEDFLIDQTINALKAKVPNPSLNVETIDGRELSLATLSLALGTQPLLGGGKLVIVRDFKVAAEEQDKLISTIKHIPPDIQVVFQAESIDKRSKFYKLMNERGEVIEFRSFAPWEQSELTGWISEQVKSEGKRISADASRLLVEICGNNLRLLSKEIEKIVTYIGERSAVEEDDVLALASAGEISAFALIDALRKKDLNRSLAVFLDLLRNKEEPFQLLGLLTTQYRLMLQIKSLGGRDNDPNQITRTIGGSPYFIKKCLPDVANFSLDELKQAMAALLECSSRLKTGEQQSVTFELLLTALCGK